MLHLDHSLEPGGAELALLRMVIAEPPWSPTLLLFTSRKDGYLGVFKPAAEVGVPVTRLSVDSRSGASSTKVLQLGRWLCTVLVAAAKLRHSAVLRNADVVHANTSRTALIAAVALLGTKTPLVVHLRDEITRSSLGRFGHAAMKYFVIPRAHALVANSASTLRTAGRPRRSTGASSIVPSAAGITGRPSSVGKIDEVRFVAMIARLDPWKGQHLLLDAFAAAFPSPSTTRLQLAGGVAFGHALYREQLKQQAARLALSDRVDFLGHVEDPVAVIDRADICVQCSTRPEPLGQNVLQYLARAKPTLAADAGGPTEWITEDVNGMLFHSGSGKHLAQQLERLAGDGDLRRRLATSALHTDIPTDSDISVRLAEVFNQAESRRHRRSS